MGPWINGGMYVDEAPVITGREIGTDLHFMPVLYGKEEAEVIGWLGYPFYNLYMRRNVASRGLGFQDNRPRELAGI